MCRIGVRWLWRDPRAWRDSSGPVRFSQQLQNSGPSRLGQALGIGEALAVQGLGQLDPDPGGPVIMT